MLALSYVKEVLFLEYISFITSTYPNIIFSLSTTTQNPLTHIYQYDLGFPPPLQQSTAKKFNSR